MAALITKIIEGCNYLFDELYDDRTRDDWPNAGTLATILISYLYFSKKAGPAWMKDKKPYDLTKVIFYYNIFQIIGSAYMAFEGFKLFLFEYDLKCQPVSYEDTPSNRKMHNLVWMYTIMKLIELLDTVFFVLRKKTRQISTLHVYHHFAMPICSFVSLKYYPNGHGVSLGIINCFVHMIMYTYYLIAGMGPQYQKYLWWKQHVTSLQIIQFIIVFFHNLYPLFIRCSYPSWINAILCICNLHFVYMFGNFYYENYIKTKNANKLDKNS